MTQPAPGRTSADPWVEAWLSLPRFTRYLNEAGDDRDRALDLSEWNLRLGAALMRDIAHVEVVVHNAFGNTMRTRRVLDMRCLGTPGHFPARVSPST